MSLLPLPYRKIWTIKKDSKSMCKCYVLDRLKNAYAESAGIYKDIYGIRSIKNIETIFYIMKTINVCKELD